MAATVKITNTLTKVIADATGIEAVISPTGIPTPCTPVQSYIADMATITSGTLLIPAYNKVQMLSIPFGAYTTFTVEDDNEINYWENIKVDGAKVEVTVDDDEGIKPVNQYVFTKVVITGTGTEEDPYVPAYAAGTYYAPGANGGEPAQDATAIASATGWGETVTTVYTRKPNILPTNDVQG